MRPRWPLTPPPPPEPLTRAFTLHDVTLVHPGQPVTPGREVVVHHGRIRDIVTAGAEPPHAPALAPFHRGYVVPGLVDMHSHLPAGNALRMTGVFLLLHLAHGVTTVRDAGDLDGTAVQAARRLLADGHPGPRITSAGAFVAAGPPRWPNTLRVNGPRDAADAVARLADAGNQWVKSYENLDETTIRALIGAADRHGLGVLGHVPTPLRHEQALLPDSQHFFGVPEPADLSADTVVCRGSDWHRVDSRRIDEVVAASVTHRLAHTPTLVATEGLLAYRDPHRLNRPGIGSLPTPYPDVLWDPGHGLAVYRGLSTDRLDRLDHALGRKLQLLARLHSAGVELRLGTDTQQPFVVPGLALHREMQLFGRAGIPTADIWRLATTDAAQALGRRLGEPALGRLEPDATADFLIYDRDPTDALDPATGLLAVVSGGALYRKGDLDRAVARQAAHFRQPFLRYLANTAAKRRIARAGFR